MLGFSGPLRLLSLITAALPAFAGPTPQSGGFYLQVSEGCIIVAQPTLSIPLTLQALRPICGTSAEGNIAFPLSSAANEIFSDIFIYADLSTVAGYGGNTAKAGCVMEIYGSQLAQLFDNSWTWDSSTSQLVNLATGAVLSETCVTADVAANPSFLYLPNPFELPPTAGEFSEVIPIVAPNSKRQKSMNATGPVEGWMHDRISP